MSRHVSIIKLLVGMSLISACSTSRTEADTAAVVRVHHCLGDVVPLCSVIRVSDTGLIEYAQPGRRTVSGKLTPHELSEILRVSDLMELQTWQNTEEPIGSFVAVETASGKGTLPMATLPEDAIPLLRVVDDIGQRVFGSAYRRIFAGRS